MPKLMLINPHPPGRKGEEDISVIVQMPLNLAYIAAMTPDHWEKDVIDETLELALDEKGEPTFTADYVGITAVTYQAARAYKIAQACRKKGMKVIMGGIHASVNPEEAMQYVDAVCTGEAELIWPKIFADMERGTLQKRYDGGLPELVHLKEVYPDREFMKQKYNYKFSSIVTTKGCPFRCEFCSVPTYQGRLLRERPPEDVWAEMEATSYRGLMFAEDNFYGYSARSKERALRLFRGMVERGIWKDWFGFSTLGTGDDSALLDYMARSGCFGFLVGLESDEEEVLRRMVKDINLKLGPQRVRDNIKRIHDHGLIIWSSVIFGADFQGPDSFKRITDYILSNSLDVLTFGISCPFPKTGLYNRLEKDGRIFRKNFPEDWVYYDTAHVTYQLERLTLDEFIEGMHYVYDHVYGKENLRERFRNTLKATGNIRNAMFAYRVSQDWQAVFEQVLDNLHRLADSGEYPWSKPYLAVA